MADSIGGARGISTRSLEQAQRGLQRNLAQLSSAKRITRAADDAAGLAIAENLHAAERSFQQGIRNLSDGVSVVQTAEGGLAQSSEIVGRLRELSVRAQNGAIGDAGRAAIQQEFDQLTSELTRISKTTQFNGRKLLNGEASGENAVRVRDGTSPEGADIEVSIADQSAAALDLDGLDAADGATLERLDRALGSISSTRAGLGAAQSRLSSSIENLRSVAENTEAARSRIQDADFAEVTAERTRNQIQEQAGVATQAQANISASAALQLLRG